MTNRELIEKLNTYPLDWKVFVDYEEMEGRDCQSEVIDVYVIDQNEIGLTIEM